MKELKMIYSVKLRIKVNLWNKIEKIITNFSDYNKYY